MDSSHTDADTVQADLNALTIQDHQQDSAGENLSVIASIAAKLTAAKETSIDILPTEVIEQILVYTKVDTGDRWPMNDEYPVLKTLRVVSSAFNKFASPYLFKTITLYEHPDRYGALNNIAHTSYLAPLVERIQLANLGYLPDCVYPVAGEEESHNCAAEEKCGGYDYWYTCRQRGPCITLTEHPPAGGPLAALDFSPSETYKRYVTWRDGERNIKEHLRNGTAPHLDLPLLSNLQHVETVGLHEMRVVKRKPDDHNGVLWTQRPETRRFYETGLIEENALLGIKKVTLCHLPIFIIAASTAGKDLTSLTVHRLDELFKGQEYDNFNPALQMRGLRRLVIDLSDIWYRYCEINYRTKLAPWLHGLNNLEDLHIFQNPAMPHFQADVLRLLRDLSLPKLANIKLRHVLVGYKILKQFLSRHNSTLRTIEIFEPVMDHERWGKLCDRYRFGKPLAQGKEIYFFPSSPEMDDIEDGQVEGD